jgi:membrane protein CcdC involved in cytochrome C biogenesis
MNPPDLLVICVSALIAVFVLLSFLAAVMRLLMSVYPAKVEGIEAATLAAVTAAATFAFPGTRVTNVEEIR